MADSVDYRKWIQRADQDKKMLEVIYETGIEGMEDSFCYICHQGTEKILKALILRYERDIIKSHDLIYLLGRCVRYKPQLKRFIDAVTILNEYPVIARYPGDLEEQRTVDEAKETYGLFCMIYDEIIKLF